jgi:hypothetical protein
VYTRKDVAEGAAWLGLGVGAWIAIAAVFIVIGTVGSIIGWKAANFRATATAGDRVQVKNLGTDNIINKQNYFFATDQDYIKALAQVKLYQGKAERDKSDHATPAQLQADEDGVTANQQSCIATATAYNGQSQNFNSGQFRAINLPASLDAGACSQ